MQALKRRVEAGGALSGAAVPPAAQPFFAALLRQLFPQRPLVVVTDGLKTQESFHQDIGTWREEMRSAECGVRNEHLPQPLFYPAWEILPHESKLPHADVISERLETLVALSSHAPRPPPPAPLVVTTVTALLQKTFPAAAIAARTRALQRGDQLDPLDLIEWLEEQGYEPEAQVTHKGEIALRGGILDLFPLTSPWPVRLEFFGNELESLRHFDPATQISKEEIASVTIPPGGELGILKREVERGPAMGGPASTSQMEETPNPLKSSGHRAVKRAEARAPFATLLDYLPRETIFLLCEPDALETHAATYAGQIPANDPFFIPWEEFLAQLEARKMTVLEIAEAEEPVGVQALACFPDRQKPELQLAESEFGAPVFTSLDAFRPIVERAMEPQIAEAQRREFFSQLHRWVRQGQTVHVFCNNAGERQRFNEIWKEYGFDDAGINLATHLGALARGFIYEEAKLVVVTDAEIFGRYKVQRPRRLKSPHAAATRSALDIDFADLEEGDYVVHLQHGIGRYLGLKTLTPGRGTKPGQNPQSKIQNPQSAGPECLVIEYASADPDQPAPKLYVPVSEAHLVSKYVGAGKFRPPLNTLGGARWAKTKAHAENAVRDLAAELLAIQAARESKTGHSFPEDNPWQREFEASFLFEETPDQMRAIVETKRDLESPRPMDRLICGDVGYGKTEVAIRAAFKAVMGGKQVAILVPTTVLAQQHFNTFRDRMADYPVRIELLSRFRTAREQKRVVEQLATGGVDIVIGTHRLVQNDIAFNDLGLVVIDEEQRFGVMHKEKFKLLRRMVDVLTLSATPIPRTLYLALTGARDMSTIETPPADRLPVETIVAQYDERVIRDAIQREINREGQVFYLHNRVFDIDAVAARLKALVPHARIVVGHGQMHADDLERVMTQFVNGEADVLLSTTIIESGLDIPNANTIIIDRADRFGLSNLYQLRGRVGRYKHQAFAYLLLPRHAGLLSDARKRMSAIKQYSSLGSGFKIAMRDLEIRGAGNLLGPQQSGHITAVGFELYCQLLKQSVSSLKGEKVKPRIETQVRLDFIAFDASEERPGEKRKAESGKAETEELRISIPRDVAVYYEEEPEADAPRTTHHVSRSPAYVPFNYITDSRARIEVYRKLAQATDRAALEKLSRELRDRFGPLPKTVELLLQIGELKLLAADRHVTVIETQGEKLMLTRHSGLLTMDGKFPRLTKKEASAKLKEIKRLLLAL